jgi:hypothetical protein
MEAERPNAMCSWAIVRRFSQVPAVFDFSKKDEFGDLEVSVAQLRR